MKRNVLALLILIGSAASALPAHSAREHTPPGSFLPYRAATVRELAGQISGNAKIKARYARHFRTSGDEVVKRLGSGLKLVQLQHARRVQSWYVGKNGRTYKKTKLFPKGTLVFATSDGRPVLSWSCGNPLRASLPGRGASTSAKGKTKGSAPSVAGVGKQDISAGAEVQTQEPEMKIMAQPVEIVSAPPMIATPDLLTEPEPSEAPAEQAPPAEPVVMAAGPAPPAVPVIVTNPAGPGFGWLGGLAGLFGGLALAGGGSSVNATPTPPEPPAVPEPGSLIALGVGLSMAAAVSRRRRAR